jgi:hypothetical protein
LAQRDPDLSREFAVSPQMVREMSREPNLRKLYDIGD